MFYGYSLLLLLIYFQLSTQDSEPVIIDHAVDILSFSKIDLTSKELHFTFDLEQGVNGYLITTFQPKLLSQNDSIAPFDGVVLQLARYHQMGPIYASTNGEITTGIRRRFDATVSCDTLHNFPFDSLNCVWKIISVRSSKDLLDIKWKPRGATYEDKKDVDGFAVEEVESAFCIHRISLPSASSTTSTYITYGCLSVSFYLRRVLLVPIIRFYLPTSLALCLAWLALYTQRNNTIARILIIGVSIGVNCYVTVSFLSTFPTTSILSPADVWSLLQKFHFGFLIIFVFILGIYERRVIKLHKYAQNDDEMRKESVLRYQRQISRHMDPSKRDKEEQKVHSFEELMTTKFRQKADSLSLQNVRLQLIARSICPFLFAVTTVVYFLLYVIPPDRNKH